MSEGQLLMNLGKDRVELNNQQWVYAMRTRARVISGLEGRVTTDDLHRYVNELGHPKHPNAWGAIFRNNKALKKGTWHVIGYEKSKRKEARSRRIAVWIFKDKSVNDRIANDSQVADGIL